MRLIRLKVRNIASLRGEHIIDFAQIQNQSPLFAITGETGSGKSSILNSIGLALYGQIFKKNVTQNDVVTLGEKEGQIELIFEVKGKKYLAYWKARVRKQNGELYAIPQSPTRELYLLDGQDFESQRTITTKKVDEILNLDFDQFSKCVVLNQGEFAKFLSSSFSERKDILEKLYPGEVLDSLSRELKLQMDSLVGAKEKLEIELGTLMGDGTNGIELAERKTQTEAEFTLLEKWLGLIEKLDYHFKSFHTYHTRHGEYKKRIENTKTEYSTETTQYNLRLKATEEAGQALRSAQQERDKNAPRLQELLKTEEALSQLKVQLDKSQKVLSSLEAQFQDLKKQLETILKRQQNCLEAKTTIAARMTHSLELISSHQDKLDNIFDSFNSFQLAAQDLKSKNENLQALEIQGKELARSLEEAQAQLIQLPADGETQLKILLDKKKNHLQLLEERQKNELKLNEARGQLELLKKESAQISDTLKTSAKRTEAIEQELTPLRTTLKLQELLTAVQICLEHPSVEKNNTCPVCQHQRPAKEWQALKLIAQKNDFKAIQTKEAELSRQSIQLQEEMRSLKNNQNKNLEAILVREKEFADLFAKIKTLPPETLDIDAQINSCQRQNWERESHQKEILKLTNELGKTRENYKHAKQETTHRVSVLKVLEDKLKTYESSIQDLAPQGLKPELINILKNDLRLLTEYQKTDSEAQRIHLEKTSLESRKADLDLQHLHHSQEVKVLSLKIEEFTTTLVRELKGESAEAMMKKLISAVKTSEETMQLREQELKKQDDKLKEFQSKLYSFEEQVKDCEVQFSNERHALKENSQLILPHLRDELQMLRNKLGGLSLNLESPQELFLPLQDLLNSEKELLKKQFLETRGTLASIVALLGVWEAKLDKMKLLELKKDDLIQKLMRLERLFEVLGKDELRSFVLSLVEENLIAQTNDELGRLCQGRYEIVHQSRGMRMTPEFYILDKYRDGRRKVSTLSGGETFMVSLAMALGLAEMTRGQAEIDSLFIDEGFGSLDPESLDDVLDMLNQIQNRGLLVGIISHIKPLTNSLQVNVVLNKKQDGTSSISVHHN